MATFHLRNVVHNLQKLHVLFFLMAAFLPLLFEQNELNLVNDASKDSELDNQLEKIHFADLMKGSKSSADFCVFHR